MLVKVKNADNNFPESTLKSSDTVACLSPLGSENKDKKQQIINMGEIGRHIQ